MLHHVIKFIGLYSSSTYYDFINIEFFYVENRFSY